MPELKTLALTGVPGWLTSALLDHLIKSDSPWKAVRALAHPTVGPTSLDALRTQWPILREFSAYDLASPRPIEKELEGADAILHAAGVIHVHRTRDWYRVNTEGTIALAKSARSAGVRRFIFISSNAAGGASDRFDHLLTEDTPARPRSHYGKSKWLAEQALMAMHVPDQFEVVILRPSMFYGPPVPPRHVEIYHRILLGRMPIVGDGAFARSITYIDNLVQACKLALCRPTAAGQTYYVTDARVYTTKQIVDEMARALGATARYWRLPRVAGPAAYALDRGLAGLGLYWQSMHLLGESDWHVGISPAKAMKELGYKPDVDLATGMRRAVDWCRAKGSL